MQACREADAMKDRETPVKAVAEQMRELLLSLPDDYGVRKSALYHMDICLHCGCDERPREGMSCQCWNDE